MGSRLGVREYVDTKHIHDVLFAPDRMSRKVADTLG
jgi:hypothetical protein